MKTHKIEKNLKEFTEDTQSALSNNVEIIATMIRYTTYFMTPLLAIFVLNLLLSRGQLGGFIISFVSIIVGIPFFAYLMIRFSRFLSEKVIPPMFTYPLKQIVKSIGKMMELLEKMNPKTIDQVLGNLHSILKILKLVRLYKILYMLFVWEGTPNIFHTLLKWMFEQIEELQKKLKKHMEKEQEMLQNTVDTINSENVISSNDRGSSLILLQRTRLEKQIQQFEQLQKVLLKV